MKTYEVNVGLYFSKVYTVQAENEDSAREIAELKAEDDDINTFAFGDMYSEVIAEYEN